MAAVHGCVNKAVRSDYPVVSEDARVRGLGESVPPEFEATQGSCAQVVAGMPVKPLETELGDARALGASRGGSLPALVEPPAVLLAAERASPGRYRSTPPLAGRLAPLASAL